MKRTPILPILKQRMRMNALEWRYYRQQRLAGPAADSLRFAVINRQAIRRIESRRRKVRP